MDDKTGYATLPEGPGLGIQIDIEKLQKLAADPNDKWKFPRVTLSDGSVADY